MWAIYCVGVLAIAAYFASRVLETLSALNAAILIGICSYKGFYDTIGYVDKAIEVC
ncbi:MAG: hypothetical protein ABSG92_08120 [Conexivisphaerales archaeon]|jgi:hypothetical protein